jgi:formate--tetrahydrofolate ligase
MTMPKLDPVKLADWEIAEAAEPFLRPISEIAAELGLLPEELIPYGRLLAKVDATAVHTRLGAQPRRAKYIDITAITPTPLGEGKTTTTLGLVQGLGRLGKRALGTVRQPSGGPTFNIKGSAAGGGLAQVVPLSPLSLGLTGDIDAITNANNLAMVALTARMQHERNYDDARLAQSRLTRLDIDPARVQMRWAIDFCAQALRNIEIGRGGHMDGFQMHTGFYITVASEVMAVLAMASDLADLRARLGKIIVAYSKSGRPVTTADLEVDGAMAAWLTRAVNPTLMQTLEGQPMLVHAGPFANIAIGQSSVIADRLGAALSDYLVTESGFASDIGFEKFWNIKCRCSGLTPDAVVIVATVRALKLHGGGPAVQAGRALDPIYTSENLELLEKGCANLLAHIGIVQRAGVRPVVCLNSFHTDTPAEQALVRRIAEDAGARFAVSSHWLKGGEGARELAEQVIEACEEPGRFAFLSDLADPLSMRIEAIVKEVYGGDGVTYSAEAAAKLAAFEADPAVAHLPVCMAKTQYSLSHDPKLHGRPKGWTLPVRDLLLFQGAGLVVPVAGDIKLMPGTASNAAFRRVDIDTATGKVKGLF